jgi:hypothetical protein
MAKQIITNLHQSFKNFENNNDLVKNIRSKIEAINAKIPDLIGHINISQHISIRKTKSKLLQGLNKKRKKFRLALESLGWGTLADLLDSAFCGEKLNLWV